MAAMPAHVSSRRPARNYWDVLDGWTASSARDHLSPSTQLVFYALLHTANRRFFPSIMDVDKKTLATLSKVSREAVRRALPQLVDANLIHLASTSGRGRVQVRICYKNLEATPARPEASRTQSVRRTAARAQIVHRDERRKPPKPQSSCGYTGSKPTPQVTRPGITPDCRPTGQLNVPEVGGDLREESPCPRCGAHPLAVRFKTDPGSRTKQRFLACSGYQSGGCRGFTWNLGSSAYQPSQRVLSQALSGARDVPGRPPLVRDMEAARRVEEAYERVSPPAPTDLGEWIGAAQYLPEEIMLVTLAEVDPELAARHRELGSDKKAILRDVRSHLTPRTSG